MADRCWALASRFSQLAACGWLVAAGSIQLKKRYWHEKQKLVLQVYRLHISYVEIESRYLLYTWPSGQHGQNIRKCNYCEQSEQVEDSVYQEFEVLSSPKLMNHAAVFIHSFFLNISTDMTVC